MKPPQVLRECIETVRLLLTGEKISYDGRFVKFDDVGLNFTPVRPRVPLWVAGASPLGLRIAAQLGDGILLDAGTSPEYSASAIARIRESREEAGLAMDGYTVAQLVNTSIEDTRAKALDAIRWEVASKFKYASTGWAKIAVGETAIPSDAPDRLSAIYQSRGEQALLEAIDDDFAAALTASGTDDDVAARVQRYRDAGVDFPILRATAAHQIPALLAGAPASPGRTADDGRPGNPVARTRSIAAVVAFDLDGPTGAALIDGTIWTAPRRFTEGGYDISRALPRTLDLLERHGVRATYFVPPGWSNVGRTRCGASSTPATRSLTTANGTNDSQT